MAAVSMNINDFDSKEELYFYYWLMELSSKGLCSFKYQPKTFDLFKGSDYTIKFKSGKVTPRDVSYTPDFAVQWDERLRGILFSIPETDDKKSIFIAFKPGPVSVIDIKGGFSRGRGANSSAITFPFKQKWLLQSTGLYVQKIVPISSYSKKKDKQSGLFLDTFTPARYLLTEKGSERKLHHKPKMINKYLEENGIK